MSDTVFTFNTRHPEYSAHQRDWERARDAYSGGFDYIRQALIRHVSEIPLEFEERLRRAYYFNYPRNIAQRITQYALSVDPVRTGADSAATSPSGSRSMPSPSIPSAPAPIPPWSRTGAAPACAPTK